MSLAACRPHQSTYILLKPPRPAVVRIDDQGAPTHLDRRSAALSEYESRFLSRLSLSVNRKVQGSSPCPEANSESNARNQLFTAH